MARQGERGAHVAANGIAGDRDPRGVETLLGAVLGDPAGDRIRLLERGRIAGLRREAVVGEDDGCTGPGRELADQAVVGVAVAEHPAGAVDVHDHGKRSDRSPWAQDANGHLAGRSAWKGGVLDVDVRLCDLTGLHLVDGLATFYGTEVEEIGRVGSCLDERLRSGLEDCGLDDGV